MDAAVVPHPASRGRPREFCTEQALQSALTVFWKHGYEGASLTELTQAMGVTRPSLYAAFGNKEQLFRKALDLYEREKMAFMEAALSAPTAKGVAQAMLTHALERQLSGCDPNGCMTVSAAMACSPGADSVRQEVVARRAGAEVRLLERLRRAQAEGDFTGEIDPVGLMRHLGAVLWGMAVLASSGVPRDELERMIATTLALWPGR